MAFMAALPLIVSAVGSIAGGYLAGRGQKQHESKMEKTKRHLVDDLLSSLRGGGSYSDLFNTDEAAFKKSFLDPAKSMFNNQIAPQIQQNYIASGQQRSSGLEDQMLRAGVDLDQLLNSEYLNFQNKGKDRMSNALSAILGGGSGAPKGPSGNQNLMSSIGGFLTSPGFTSGVSSGINDYNNSTPSDTQTGAGSGYSAGMDAATNMAMKGNISRRKGFAQDNYGAYA